LLLRFFPLCATSCVHLVETTLLVGVVRASTLGDQALNEHDAITLYLLDLFLAPFPLAGVLPLCTAVGEREAAWQVDASKESPERRKTRRKKTWRRKRKWRKVAEGRGG